MTLPASTGADAIDVRPRDVSRRHTRVACGHLAGPRVLCDLSEALSQTAFAEDGARDSKLLLARDGRRGVRCSPVHPNIRGRAAYVDNPGMHRAARSFGEGARVDISNFTI